MVQVVTGDSQEKVMIFRDKQTLHHNIYIAIIITLSWFLVTSLSSVTKWREEILSDLSRNPHRGHLIVIVVGTFFRLSFFFKRLKESNLMQF